METWFRMLAPRPYKPPEPYNYYAAPDGQDVPQKMRHVIKNFGLVGIGIATIDVMLYSHPVTYMAMVRRFTYMASPVIAGGMIFTWSSNFLGKLKESYTTVEECKNECLDAKAAKSAWNWGIGAGLATFLMFAYTNRVGSVLLAVLHNSLLASGIRYADIIGYPIVKLYDVTVQMPSGNANRWDFTLTKERERNWTTVAAEEQTEIVETKQL